MKKILLLILCLSVIGINFSEAKTKRTTKKNVKKTTAVVSSSVYNKTYYGINTLYAEGNGNTLNGDMQIIFYEKRDEPASFCKINLYVNYGGQKYDMGSMVCQFFVNGDTLRVCGNFVNSDAAKYGAVGGKGWYHYGFQEWIFIISKDTKSISLQEDSIKQDGKIIYVSGILSQTSDNSNRANSDRSYRGKRTPNASNGTSNYRVGREVIVY